MFRAVGRFVVGMLLVVFMLLFIVMSVATYSIDRDTILELAGASAASAYREEIEQRAQETDINEAYAQILEQCDSVGGESISLGEGNIVLSCSEIRRVGASGIESYVLGEIEEGAGEAILQRVEESEAGPFIDYILTFGRATSWVLGGVALVLVLLLLMLSVPRYHFLIDVGFVAIIVGMPLFMLSSIDLSLPYTWASEVNEFARNVVTTLYIVLLAVFILGIVCVLGGFVWKRWYGHKIKRVQKSKEINQKALSVF